MFTEKDLQQLSEKGISPELVQEQIEKFEKGFPFIRLAAPATPGQGILKIDKGNLYNYVDFYEQQAPALDVLKFVPASGAATRMFKDLFAWRDSLANGILSEKLIADDALAATFFSQIQTFAFWDDLVKLLAEMGMDAEASLQQKDFLPLLNTLLDEEGLGYAMLPKGLLRFHRYEGYNRTSLEEHLVEGANYARKADGTVKLHFTVSAEHRGRFINHSGDVIKAWEELLGVRFEIKFSVQKPATDTLAVDMENKPFRNNDDSLLFRPGGHGALIQNLNELNEDIVFVKNIDNVVPDHLKAETYTWKKALGGLLLDLQQEVFQILEKIDSGNFSDVDYGAARNFAIDQLCLDANKLPDNPEKGVPVLKDLLARPMRICGMVKNEGEPGGGPFWVENPEDKSLSLQIVESSQVNHQDAAQKSIFEQSTHFNPVDLVCAIKDRKGQPYDLTRFVDASTGFISVKSKDGRDLKAQELPGLWNGAMAGWITIFAEVPLITFNPVKTIMDLLREEHR